MRQHYQSKSRRLTRRAASTVLAGTALALAAGIGAPAMAAEWPTKAITIVVAYPAGGGTDISIRALTDTLGEKLGQPILVQNVGGAGGGVAATKVAKEPADGYTLLATNSTSITLAPLVQKALYDMDSFEHVAIIGEFQNAFFTGSKQPYDSLDGLIKTVKAENRAIKGASQLAIDRLVMQFIAKERGVEFVPVPVSGGSGSVQAVMSGDVDVAFSGGSWAPIVKAGDAKALFAASYERLKLAPDLVSMKDLGFPFGVTAHISLHAPAGTPPEVVKKIAAALEPAVNSEMVQTVGQKRFMDMTYRGGDAAAAVMKKERETYVTLVKTVGMN
ncbi:MAG: tripartite tricarboxylate transporter substrate binding protein [Thalassobaculum sp.]|uniref:tripartite tricarboxylate transporter substrate binding protein n=1 Tax=Thalassobaculum sp. TaxID=2022740 RepID=UPI0032EF5B19